MEIINFNSIKRNRNFQTKTQEFFKSRYEANTYSNWKARRLENTVKKRELLTKSRNAELSEINNISPEAMQVLQEIKSQMISFSYKRYLLNLDDTTIYKLNELAMQCDKIINWNYFLTSDDLRRIDEIIDAACMLKSEIVMQTYRI